MRCEPLDANPIWVQVDGEAAGRAATLLGAAHAVRGAFDEGGAEAPCVRSAAREALGAAAFEAAYESGRALSRDEAVTLVTQALDR